MEKKLTTLKEKFRGIILPEFAKRQKLEPGKEVYLITNGDLRKSANLKCWDVQREFETGLIQ